ncbi:MAG: TonB-dependent receptor [Phenylobacterium sp.]|nr:TonB-dependent receptor [Phenylobacterium sp.]
MSKALLLSTTVVVAVGFWSGTAMAAEEPRDQREDATVQEVTVTARRIEENLQQAPVAVTAVSAEQLTALHPHDLSALSGMAPNFKIQGSGSIFRNSSIAFARGIGYNNIDGTLDPALGITLDGVPYLRNIGALQNMFDLSSVEIVLGPQGTLYGKNTIAGVMNITTQKPKLNEFEARVWTRFGNLQRRDAELVANFPWGETFAVRFAFQSQTAEGAYKNRTPGGPEVGGDDTKTARLSLRWEPNERFDVTATGTILRNRSESVGGTNASAPGSLPSVLLGHAGLGYPGGQTDPYLVERTWPSGDYFDMDGVTLEARYHADGFDVISVSNYMHDRTPLNYDDFTYAGLLNNYAIVDHEQYSTELRAQSTGEGPLQWVVGGFYDNGYYDYWQSFSNFIPVALGAPAPSISNQWIFQWSHSYSAFGQVDYALTDKLSFTVGARALSETKRAKNYANFVGPTTRDLSNWPTANIIRGKKTWNAVTYRVGAKYQVTEDFMAYASYSTGFHSGGFNSAAQAGATVNPGVTAATLGPWEPEKARSMEAGFRSDWFDNRLQVNLTGFWTYYDDLQSFATYAVNAASGLNAVGPANAGKERARGLELQARAVPVRGLRLNAAVGYLDAEYTSFKTFRNNLPYDCVAQGCKPVRSPDWTARIDAAYDIRTEVGTFTPTVAYNYTSSIFTDTFNEPFGRVGAYALMDAALNYEAPSGRWGASVWAKNLTDKRYVLATFYSAALGAQTYYFADPKTYGIELHVKFGQ